MLNVRALVREYHNIADIKTKHINQLTKELSLVFPGYKHVFSNITGKTSIAILRVYKTPTIILETPKKELVKFISNTSRKGIDRSIKVYNKLINAAKTAVTFSHQLSSSYDLIELQLDLIDMFQEKKNTILEKIQYYLEKYKKEKFIRQIKLLETL